MRPRHLLLASALLALAVSGRAADYTFEPIPAESVAKVTVRLGEGKVSNEFWMPAWAPGDYELFNYGKQVKTISFKRDGETVTATRTDNPNVWIVEGGADEVTYTVGPSAGNFSLNLRVRAEETFASPPGVLGWFAGHARERQTLTILKNPVGSPLESTLKRLEDTDKKVVLEAPDYDQLIDAPFVMGKWVKTEPFTVRGKNHAIVGYGSAMQSNLKAYAQEAAKIVEQAFQLFGELPYQRYVFFCDFGRGGGGLEHADSTVLSIGRAGDGVPIHLISHEYVHAFNVKRIRAKSLGPFDYTKPAATGTIWWLEGVTDYYATVFMVRAGMDTPTQALAQMGQRLQMFNQRPSSHKVSADESSRRVWEVEGSFGFGGASYYEQGFLIGFALDLAIRGESMGRYSLDDVMRTLYQETRNGQPGYSETRIRELCVQYGGDRLGPIYDQLVMKPGPYIVDALLPAAGLKWTEKGLAVDPNASQEKRAIGRAWPLRSAT